MIDPPWKAAYRGRRVLVLGAGGFIGRWVARALCQSGARLTAIVRDVASFAAIREQWDIAGDILVADLSSPNAIERICREVQPIVVFNAVGYGVDREETDPRLAWRLNAGLPPVLGASLATLTRTEAWTGRRLIHLGTALEYGRVSGDLDEAGPTAPSTMYGRSKLCGTLRLSRLANRHRLPAVTARLFTVFGAGEHPSRLLPSLMAATSTNGPIRLTAGVQRRDFLWAGDVAEYLLRLGVSEGPPGEVVNLASGELTQVRHFIEAAARRLGLSGTKLEFGAIPTRPEEMSHAPVAVDKLTRLVGPPPSGSIARGLEATIMAPDGPGRRPPSPGAGGVVPEVFPG